jgi:peptidoglycan/xylan/chitin deacetylase (PgdA/CDA1 family)
MTGPADGRELIRLHRYEYSAITDRKPLKLPNNARVVVWIGINVEYFDIESREFGGVSSFRVDPPNVFDYSLRDYGNRVGFWRIAELLDKFHVRASVLLNSRVCAHYPAVVRAAKDRKWEFVGHGTTNSVLLGGMGEDDEREIIRTSIETIEQAVGERPKGWLGPALQETFNTPDLLAEAGIKYLCDWCCDDQPFAMKVKTGSLISVPYTVELNDFNILLLRNMSPQEYFEQLRDHFDVLYEEGLAQPRVMCLGLHPFIIGQPSRIRWLEQTIAHISSHANVWMATAWEIAEWYHRCCMKDAGA